MSRDLSDSDLARRLQREYEDEERRRREEEEEATRRAIDDLCLAEELSRREQEELNRAVAMAIQAEESGTSMWSPISGLGSSTGSSSDMFFNVQCPYPTCSTRGTLVDSRHFPRHVCDTHSGESSHEFACPTCELFNGDTYTVVAGTTNLLNHCSSGHTDLLALPPVRFGEPSPTVSSKPIFRPTGVDTSRLFTKHAWKSTMEETECIICMDDFEEGKDVASLVCLHTYHVCCISTWLNKSMTCPLCKTTIGS